MTDSDIVAANSGTTAVREGYRFDEAALAAWMEANVKGFAGPLVVEQFKGGQSNPTYKLVTPGKSYVMRRKPPGELLPGAMPWTARRASSRHWARQAFRWRMFTAFAPMRA